MVRSVIIVGGSLTGLMCALHLVRRGYHVSIFEAMSNHQVEADTLNQRSPRSISMDISTRGIEALKTVGLFEKVKAFSVPMNHKITHDIEGHQKSIPYGQFEHEFILTIARNQLYKILLDECRNFDTIKVIFSHRLIDLCPNKKESVFRNELTHAVVRYSSDIVIGADGVNSSVRSLLESFEQTHFHIEYFPMSYKALSIPARFPSDLNLNAMHTWPRDGFMLTAQPNLDGSFGCALLMHESGNTPNFNNIRTPKAIRSLFNQQLPDASIRMPNLEDEYINHPSGKLKTVSSSQWGFYDFVLLLGDSVHAMVPFFGQGVNCCFEDCTFLLKTLDEVNDHWPSVLSKFNNSRVKDAAAIRIMSHENYPELFLNADLQKIELIKDIEALLSARYRGTFRTYHNLVCFDQLPYELIQKIKQLQLTMFNKLSQNISQASAIPYSTLDEEMNLYCSLLSKLEIEPAKTL